MFPKGMTKDYIDYYLLIMCKKMYTCVLNICLKLLEDFIEEFFYQNPISQLGVIITRNKRAEKISDLAGNSKKHIKVIILFIILSYLSILDVSRFKLYSNLLYL